MIHGVNFTEQRLKCECAADGEYKRPVVKIVYIGWLRTNVCAYHLGLCADDLMDIDMLGIPVTICELDQEQEP